MSIESTRLVLRIRRAKQAFPMVGDEVRLHVHLPAQAGFAARDLSVRGRVIEVSEPYDSIRTVVMKFRRAQFKDRNEIPAVRPIRIVRQEM